MEHMFLEVKISHTWHNSELCAMKEDWGEFGKQRRTIFSYWNLGQFHEDIGTELDFLGFSGFKFAGWIEEKELQAEGAGVTRAYIT